MRVERIMRWLGETILEMNQAVQTLKTASESEARYFTAWFLLAESANNILANFNSAAEVAESLQPT